MLDRDERFPDLDGAFAALRTTAPTVVPGADAAKRTVHRRRTRRRAGYGLAAVVLLVVAAGLGATVRLNGRTDTARISPATAAPGQGGLLGLTTVRFHDGAALTVPQRPGGCPAATLHLSAATRSDTVGGVEYTYYGESVLASGDLTGDGHAESVVLVDCADRGTTRHVLVVVAATGPTTYATIAARAITPKAGDPGLRVEGRRIVLYASHQQFDASTRVGGYALGADGSLTPVE